MMNASELIDDLIARLPDWRGATFARIPEPVLLCRFLLKSAWCPARLIGGFRFGLIVVYGSQDENS
jgi:hypothetical protein